MLLGAGVASLPSDGDAVKPLKKDYGGLVFGMTLSQIEAIGYSLSALDVEYSEGGLTELALDDFAVTKETPVGGGAVALYTLHIICRKINRILYDSREGLVGYGYAICADTDDPKMLVDAFKDKYGSPLKMDLRRRELTWREGDIEWVVWSRRINSYIEEDRWDNHRFKYGIEGESHGSILWIEVTDHARRQRALKRIEKENKLKRKKEMKRLKEMM